MTLVAFHAATDHADILTDTWSYSRGARYLGHAPKVLPLGHLDLAVIAQGSTRFGDALFRLALWVSGSAADGDDFGRQMADALPQLYDREGDRKRQLLGDHADLANSVAFAVGRSPERGRFVATAYASDDGFAAREVDGLHVQPSPLDVRPSDLELGRLAVHFRDNFGDTRPVDRLRRRPRPKPPTDVDGWVALATKIREHRGLVDLYSGFKTYVGGDVLLMRLEAGSLTQRRVHRFNDSGDEFAAMMRYSLHPQGQLGPCPCDSGRRMVECCLGELDPNPCPCGSGATFATCCKVDITAEAPTAA